jgi:hypothetical protein
VQPATSGAGDRGIYSIKIVTGWKLRGKGTRKFVSLFAQVQVVLAGFGVICSQDRTRRIFQFAQLWSQPKFNQQLSSTEFEVGLHSYPMIDFLLSLNLKMIMGKDQL